MAGQLHANQVSGRKPSWARCYFNVENRLLLGSKSKILAEGLADVCCLPVPTVGLCGRVSNYSLRDDKKNIVRHVLECYSLDEALKAEVARQGLQMPKVNII